MLPFKNRLAKRDDIQKVYQRGVFAAKGGLIVKYLSNQLPDTRIGFSTEKKFFPKAVERNRAKRLLREATRPLIQRIRPGLDIMIICKNQDDVHHFGKLTGKVETLLKQTNLLT